MPPPASYFDGMQDWISTRDFELGPIRLVALSKAHRDELLTAASDGRLWDIWHTTVPDADTVDDYIESALADQKAGRAVCFAVVHKYSEEVIGTTRYYNLDPENRRLEIGFTWYARRYQKTGVNTRCKYILLKYAFETLDCIAVGFMTNVHNRASRQAIERIGAQQDGILRNHRISATGEIRHSAVYSIVRDEWAAVKRNLEFFMDKKYP